MMHDLRAEINQVLQDAGREPVSVLLPEWRLREDLGFDSLELAVLTVRIEAAFGVDIFAEGLVQTVGEVQERLCPDSPTGGDEVRQEREGHR